MGSILLANGSMGRTQNLPLVKKIVVAVIPLMWLWRLIVLDNASLLFFPLA
jgi:hypothetical protein